ncbi:hypothetical protein Hesp01_74720 [Herbidospora sp. NBRC 101105]|nr:hypothetical protein Hesp01_74720 [Herbidospora sp. NBRC 101105]
MRPTVRTLMTQEVVTVHPDATFKEVAETIIGNEISGVPVVGDDGRVLGVISEEDLLRKEQFREQYYREGYQPPLRARLRHRLNHRRDPGRTAHGDTAAELMTSPAVTIGPDFSCGYVARLMEREDVKRLPVVDDAGRLIGVVSRRDLIKPFLRPDAELAEEIAGDVLGGRLGIDTSGVRVIVEEGIVRLGGSTRRRSEGALVARVIERVNGVVDVVNEMTWTQDDGVTWSGL